MWLYFIFLPLSLFSMCNLFPRWCCWCLSCPQQLQFQRDYTWRTTTTMGLLSTWARTKTWNSSRLSYTGSSELSTLELQEGRERKGWSGREGKENKMRPLKTCSANRKKKNVLFWFPLLRMPLKIGNIDYFMLPWLFLFPFHRWGNPRREIWRF